MRMAIFLPWLLTLSSGWLAKKDRWEDCHNVLALVHAKGDRNAPFVHLELQEIRDMVEFERRNADVSYFELFKPKMINRTHIGVFTQIWSQLTGMNVMMYYISCKFSTYTLRFSADKLFRRLRHGRIDGKCWLVLIFNPIRDQRIHDCPSFDLD